MKKFLFSFALVLMSCILSKGQDMIPMYSVNDYDEPMIALSEEPSMELSFSGSSAFAFDALSQDSNATFKLVPGMKYAELEQYYKDRTYTAQVGDPYNPMLSGLCSFLIPGLGQILTDEVNRGLCWLGGMVGCAVVGAIGEGIVAGAKTPAGITAGSIIGITGYLGVLVVDIWSIVDAAKVAKVKNMYNQDLKALASNVDLKLSPYLASINNGTSAQAVTGLSLVVSF